MEKRVLNDLHTNNNSVLVECGCSCACSFMRLYKECDDRYGISIYSGYYNKKYVKLENKLKFTREELDHINVFEDIKITMDYILKEII